MNEKELNQAALNYSAATGMRYNSANAVKKSINRAAADRAAGVISYEPLKANQNRAACAVWDCFGRDLTFADFLAIPANFAECERVRALLDVAPVRISELAAKVERLAARVDSIHPENATSEQERNTATAQKSRAAAELDAARNEYAAAVADVAELERAAANSAELEKDTLFVTAVIKCATDKEPSKYDAEKNKRGYIYSENGCNGSVIYYYQIDWFSGLGGLQSVLDKFKVDRAKSGKDSTFAAEMAKKEESNEKARIKKEENERAEIAAAESIKRGDIVNAAAANVSALIAAAEHAAGILSDCKKELGKATTEQTKATKAHEKASEKAAAAATPAECEKAAAKLAETTAKVEETTGRVNYLQGRLEKCERAASRAAFIAEFAEHAAGVVFGLPSVSLDDVTAAPNLSGVHAV